MTREIKLIINTMHTSAQEFPSYLIVVLISQRSQMAGTVVPYVSYMPHLTLVAVANPFHLLNAIVLNSVHLLRVVLSQSFELLTLVLLDVVEHLIDLLSSRRHTYASAAHAPLDASAPARRYVWGENVNKGGLRREYRKSSESLSGVIDRVLTFRRLVRSIRQSNLDAPDELTVIRTVNDFSLRHDSNAYDTIARDIQEETRKKNTTYIFNITCGYSLHEEVPQ